MSDSLVSPLSAGLRCTCPRCGEGDLFAGFLKVNPVCQSCGLDLAFADSGDGSDPQEILFGSPVKYLPLPMAAGTWTDNTTVTVPGEGTYTATMNGQVFARVDLPLEVKRVGPPAGFYFKGAWKVVRSFEVELDGTWFTTMRDTTWYSPTIGPVIESTREDFAARDGEPAGWYRTRMWRNLGGGEGLK